MELSVQFPVQMQLPGMPPRRARRSYVDFAGPTPSSTPPSVPEDPRPRREPWDPTVDPVAETLQRPYTSAHSMAGEWRPNPIYPSRGHVGQSDGPSRSEFIPVPHIMSGQPMINRVAVEHQVQHADPLALDDDPIVIGLTPGSEGFPEGREDLAHAPEVYAVRDGNHRVNAALARGQLFMPANVLRRPQPPRR